MTEIDTPVGDHGYVGQKLHEVIFPLDGIIGDVLGVDRGGALWISSRQSTARVIGRDFGQRLLLERVSETLDRPILLLRASMIEHGAIELPHDRAARQGLLLSSGAHPFVVELLDRHREELDAALGNLCLGEADEAHVDQARMHGDHALGILILESSDRVHPDQ